MEQRDIIRLAVRKEKYNASRESRLPNIKKLLYDMFSPLVSCDYVEVSYYEMKKILCRELPNELGLYGGCSIETNRMNCEHVWPQSFFHGEYPMKSDMNHCFFTHSKLNSHRSTYKFENLDHDRNTHYLDSYGNVVERTNIETGFSKKSNYDRSFEPLDISKGNIARAIAYFNTMYPIYDISKIIDIPTMIEWHVNDPVDDNEKERVNVVFDVQKNVNPYIVCPELLELIYKSPKELTIEERVSNLEAEIEKMKVNY
uniref:Endonuclease I n=1 Tax=Pyramimonas orientalis virus TaxID=455367 RepID=A0A7M3UP75_POV01|nr:hypothetical protein HWQ62_00413 [Pyramimonas orientalis virus]